MTCYAALIIGGGPAGASCGLWLKMLGHEPFIVERRERLGGLQNRSPYVNDWVLGQLDLRGEELAARMHGHVQARGVAHLTGATLETLARANTGHWQARITAIGREHQIEAEFLVLASGVRPCDGGFSASANVLIGPGADVFNYDFRDRRVAVLGGGDNAFENYLFIRERGAAAVHIYARHVRARRQFRERVPASDLTVGPYDADATTGRVAGVDYDAWAVMYGWEPVDPLDHVVALERDARGFVRTDARRRTSDARVYAVGEVTAVDPPCVVTCMADGVICAKDIQRRIEDGA